MEMTRTYQITKTILIDCAAAALAFGVAACCIEEAETELVTMTVGASFNATKTSLDDESGSGRSTRTMLDDASGSVLWTEGDVIGVVVDNVAYPFTIASGAGTTAATFTACVEPSIAEAIEEAMEEGNCTAFYPYVEGKQASEVQSEQAFHSPASFATNTNPMTAEAPTEGGFIFTNDAALVCCPAVAIGGSTSATLTYSGKTITLSGIAVPEGVTTVNLVFVVHGAAPGATEGNKEFTLTVCGSSTTFEASAIVTKGSRYWLTPRCEYVASIDGVRFSTAEEFKEAFNAIEGAADVVLLADIDLSDGYLSPSRSSTISLNLNGKTLQSSSTKGVIQLLGGSLSIDDTAGNGAIRNTASSSSYGIYSKSKSTSLTLNNGQVEGGTHGIYAISGGDFTISGGHVKGGSDGMNLWGAGTTQISGGLILGGQNSINAHADGVKVTVSGGYFDGHATQSKETTEETFLLLDGGYYTSLNHAGATFAPGKRMGELESHVSFAEIVFPYGVIQE